MTLPAGGGDLAVQATAKSPLFSAAERRALFGHLYWDIVGFGVLAGSTLYFQSVYAARLGASALQIGMITAGPAMVGLLTTLPAGRWMENKPLLPAAFWSSLLQRLWYLVFFVLPWLFGPQAQVSAIILISLVLTVPGVVLTIAFNAAFPELVAPQYRSEVIGKRNALVAVSLTLTYISCGYLLDHLPNPFNYQLVFGLGAAGALLSSYHLSRLRQPPKEAAGAPYQASLAANKPTPLLRLDLLAGPFGLFMLSCLAFYCFQYMPSPLFTLAFVKALHLADGQIGLGNALFYLTMMLASLFLPRLNLRMGSRPLLIATVSGFGFYPILLALVWQPWSFWLVSAVGGAVYGLISGALLNRLMERVPENDRPAHMSLHNLALNLGILLGSFLGPLTNDWLGLRYAMLASGLLRVAVGVLFWMWG